MDGVVLSGVRGIVLSGVGLSCYQACRSAANPRQHWVSSPSNFPNFISLTFSRETPLRWTTTTRPQTRQQQPGSPAWRARP
ncbi:hypothetical protein FA151_20060 [Pseudomonas aeruginosa]|uniref:Uncharacterized protein n=1 Tax=Luteimonas marina TaxID=488485 RepID=A0A5C5UCM0_9GAMM|nr:hypothetical protein [Stutzerimonas stutzeri]MCO3468947.1 hypothetical protein [Pseudomonas aeruginosa]TWT23392.1 hypothetical protein FQY83_01740 [Luteimonas marina]MBK3851036.1 hypothetical protein [Stutzerimonas stutzeri]MCO3497399.1 hypothetical protein [Pseudomonas aeruginosa]